MDKNVIVASLLRILPDKLALFVSRFHPGIGRNLPAGIITEIEYYNRFAVTIDTTYPIERSMVSGRYDHEITAAMEKLLLPGDTFVDVGANVGALSMVASALVGDKGSVISLEPGPLTHDRFKTTIARNQLSNIQLIQVGISDAPGQLNWQMDPLNPGNASLSETTTGLSVNVVTLDSLVDELSPERLSMIKIDVEGMELQVFRGAQRALATHRPSIIFETLREWRDIKGRPYFEEIERILTSNGYRLFSIEASAPHDVTLQTTGANTLAIHSGNRDSLEKWGAI